VKYYAIWRTLASGAASAPWWVACGINDAELTTDRLAERGVIMQTDDFWKIIDRVHARSPDDMDAKCESLRAELTKLNDSDMTSFIELFDAADALAYDWKLWGAAYVINGGCSDDTFSDFRATLISMGRKFFERALADPDSLAEVDYDEESAFYEGFQYVKNDVAQERLDEIPMRSMPFPAEPAGVSWEDDDLPALLPRLSRKFA
jgi:hypothetical protein